MIWKSFFDLFTTGICNRYKISTAVFWIGFACNPTIADHIANNHSHISRGRKNAINQILNAEIAFAVQGLKYRELELVSTGVLKIWASEARINRSALWKTIMVF